MGSNYAVFMYCSFDTEILSCSVSHSPSEVYFKPLHTITRTYLFQNIYFIAFSRRRSEHTDRPAELKPTVIFRTTPTQLEIIISWCYSKPCYYHISTMHSFKSFVSFCYPSNLSWLYQVFVGMRSVSFILPMCIHQEYVLRTQSK